MNDPQQDLPSNEPFMAVLITADQTDWTPQNLEYAREWLSDIEWQDLTSDDIDELPDAELIRGIQRHFPGGITEFLRTTEGK